MLCNCSGFSSCMENQDTTVIENNEVITQNIDIENEATYFNSNLSRTIEETEVPVMEPIQERVVNRTIMHEVPHICPIHTRIINHHVYHHTYNPEYSCCEENVTHNVQERMNSCNGLS